MKNKKLKNSMFLLILMVTVLFVVACSKKNGIVSQSKKLSYQFKIPSTTVPLATSIHSSQLTTLATSGGNITWQSGYANVASISFEGQNQDNHQDKDDFNEPAVYQVDLFNTNQLLGNVDIPIGDYHNVDIKIELRQTPSGPALFLKGAYASAKGNIPIELSLNEGNDNMEINAMAKDLSIGAKDSYIAFINFHLDKLMAGVNASDLDAATLTGGTIVINNNSNTTIYTKIKANIGGFSDSDYNN